MIALDILQKKYISIIKKSNTMITKRNRLLVILLLLINSNIYAQLDWNTAGNSTTGGEKIGSTSGNFDLEFYINNVKFLQLLTSGDVNVVASTNGYMINQNFVLRNNGINQNIYVELVQEIQTIQAVIHSWEIIPVG